MPWLTMVPRSQERATSLRRDITRAPLEIRADTPTTSALAITPGEGHDNEGHPAGWPSCSARGRRTGLGGARVSGATEGNVLASQ